MRFNFALATIAALLLPTIVGCQEHSHAQAQAGPASQRPKATVIRPQRKDIRHSVEQPAQLEAFETTPIYAMVSGYVREVNVDIGDQVKGPKFDAQGQQIAPGQPLMQLSIPQVEAELRQKQAGVAQAEAEAAQAEASIKVARAAIRKAQARITSAEATTRRATAQYEKWRSEYQRLAKLGESQSIATRVVDEAREQLATADANRQEAAATTEAAEAAVEESKAILQRSEADLVAAQARVLVARADLSQVQVLWEYGTLRAPFAGVITRRNVHTGHLVPLGASGEPLLVVARTDIVRIFLNVPEADAALVDVGDAAVVRVPALGDAKFPGQVTRSAWSLESAARTLRAEIDIVNRDHLLRPGMYGYAAIVVAEKKQALVLPASAIVSDKDGSFCYVVQEGRVVRQGIRLGLRSGSEIEITGGLAEDAQVIRANPAAFTPGQEVDAVAYVEPKP